MSTEEQDQILGRLIRERRETRAQFAALRVKAIETAQALEDIASAIRNVFSGQALSPAASARNAIESLPSRDEILAMVIEISSVQERLERIDRSLEEFGA